jgi:hypothetical protein
MMKARLEPWEVSEGDFPTTSGTEEKLRFLLNYAVLAPSSHNTQPWLFRIGGTQVELYADRSRALAVVDPEDRALIISCGAALHHLRVALRHFGYADEVKVLPDASDSDLLARVSLEKSRVPTEADNQLFQAITRRRTNRLPFENREVPAQLIAALQEAAKKEGAWLGTVDGDEARNAVADLIAQGDRTQGADRSFRRELAAWLHPNRSRSRDGMLGYAFGFGDLMSLAGPVIIRTFDWGNGQAARDRQLAQGSPVLAVLGTDADSPTGWLAAGQALSHVLLRASAEGVWASFLNQPIEVPELRPRLSALLSGPGFPQLLMRLGYGPEVQPTPRRWVDEVLS